ncbi:hypothetical protein [Sulfitobacter sp.]|uniref:hypothetical protein n=1 Tax=Sulfitobacter sp. TaxID=1903071 RepID=UPI003562E7CA
MRFTNLAELDKGTEKYGPDMTELPFNQTGAALLVLLFILCLLAAKISVTKPYKKWRYAVFLPYLLAVLFFVFCVAIGTPLWEAGLIFPIVGVIHAARFMSKRKEDD